tara:strand:- start:284 stop:700 length:417 start_codon:yes stop_codon:yes gene_type:complete
VKKILIYILFIIVSSQANAENVYDFFDYTWKVDRTYDTVTINAYNKHPSKTIIVEKINIWDKPCASTNTSTEEPYRIYRINKQVRSYEDRSMVITAKLPSGKKCANVDLSFKVYRTITPIQPKKKSGLQKFLDKILGN